MTIFVAIIILILLAIPFGAICLIIAYNSTSMQKHIYYTEENRRRHQESQK